MLHIHMKEALGVILCNVEGSAHELMVQFFKVVEFNLMFSPAYLLRVCL